jgi:hypothetical protein
MERIVVEVPGPAAKKWRKATKASRRRAAAILAKVLTGPPNEPKPGYARPSEAELRRHDAMVRKSKAEYDQFLATIRREAAEKGLTQEILDKLLEEGE